MSTVTEELGMSLEELRDILASKGVDIKELAKEAKAFKESSLIEKKEEKTAKPAITGPVFELALANYPDFVIRRSTPRAEKLLVMMVSQKSYYIKTVKNGAEEKQALDRKTYAAFTSGMDPIALPEGFWIDNVYSGVDFFDCVTDLLSKEPVYNAIIGRYFINNHGNRPGVMHHEEKMYEEIPALLKSFPGKDLSDSWEFYKFLIDKFGLENARDFIHEQELSLISGGIDLPSQRYCYDDDDEEKGLAGFDFAYKSFRDYILYDSVRMGYGDYMYRFFNMWEDTLNMQRDLYGKIKDKYPKHLAEVHDQLSYKCRLMKKEIDERKFKERLTVASRLEGIVGDYVFIAPKTPQDFYDEATAQSNCLAGYVDKYADGKDFIIFMRKKDKPEDSLVTIEVDLDGSLRQAFQARNTRVTEEQQKAIDKWLKTIVEPVLKRSEKVAVA